MTDFALGDIVVMKMGGPWMTVIKMLDNGDIECIWYDRQTRLQREYFESFALKPVELVA